MRREYSDSVESGAHAGSSAGRLCNDLPPALDDVAAGLTVTPLAPEAAGGSEPDVDWRAELQRDEPWRAAYALASVPLAGAAWALQAAVPPLAGFGLLCAPVRARTRYEP